MTTSRRGMAKSTRRHAPRNSRTWSQVVGVNAARRRRELKMTQLLVCELVRAQGHRYDASQLSRLERWMPYSDGSLPTVSADLLVCLAVALEMTAQELLTVNEEAEE